MEYENGQCTMPMRTDITRFKCCCSMGAAWGIDCQACPSKNTSEFYKRIETVASIRSKTVLVHENVLFLLYDLAMK